VSRNLSLFLEDMEQSEDYKNVTSIISGLEQELVKSDTIAIEQERKHAEIETEIEKHFVQCLNALAARKQVLLQHNKDFFTAKGTYN
jgi:hypothetical protein